MVSLRGKVALVTGASSGIGRAMARALAGEGVSVALLARESDRLRAVGAELGQAALCVPADLAVPADIGAAVATTVAQFGRIDILLANAGLYVAGDVAGGDPDVWDRVIQINVNSVFRLVGAVLPGMLAQAGGDIIVTSSISGHQAIHWEPVYSATKHAVQAFVHGVRRQTLNTGVRIGAVAPGMVLNELWGLTDRDQIDRKAARGTGLRDEDVAESVLFMLTRPPNVTIRDLVMLPTNQDL
jgi:ribitol 2-dehydrogenase